MSTGNIAFVAGRELFADEFKGMSWPDLLDYFQNKGLNGNIALLKGNEKHVKNAQAILDNDFEFNHERYRLGKRFDWKTNPSKDIEWLILLHKFYYFKELAGAYDFTQDEVYAEKWVDLIESWIDQVANGFIDSQVTGRRLQQWIASFHCFVTKWRSSSVSAGFFERFMTSVDAQTHHLCKHLTPEGNHRTLELYAIFLVAVTFSELRSARFFLDFSKQYLIENIRHDLLPDGVHRELSTDYHHTVLKNYLRFRALALQNQIELPAVCDGLIKRAIEFSCYVHKPDGFIPAINDGDCNSYLSLLKKAENCYPDQHVHFVVSKGLEGKPPLNRSMGFEDSGYCILRSDWTRTPYEGALYMFFDCASVGFGSHGHYDAMNIEIAAYGQSLVVDPGRYTYNENPADGKNWRRIFKGTAAHNTVVVDGLDQTPYRPGRPEGFEAEATLKKFVTASGFDFLHGQVVSRQYPAVHERKIFFLNPEYWVVIDLLRDDADHRYDLFFHLADRAHGQTGLATTAYSQVIFSPNLLVAQPISCGTEVIIEQGYVSPEYGIKKLAPVIKFSKPQASSTVFTTVLYPFKGNAQVLEVKQLPLCRGGCLCKETEATAIKIDLGTADSKYQDCFYLNHGFENESDNFEDIACSGKLLFLRRDENGRIVNLQGEGLSYLSVNGAEILSRTQALATVGFSGGTLELKEASGERTVYKDIDIYACNTLFNGEVSA